MADMNHVADHPDVAGYVFGALDPDDAQVFESHLKTCGECQATVVELKGVADAFDQALPDVEPPADLDAKCLAAVQFAMMGASRPDLVASSAQPKASRWWHLHLGGRFLPLFTAVAAAAVTAAAFVSSSIFSAAPAVAATFKMNHTPGETGSAVAVATFTTGGYKIKLDAKNLPALGPGQFYECVYVGAGNALVSGGTFDISNGTVTMQSAADPKRFTVIQIRREGTGVGVQNAPVVLRGIAQVH